MTQPLTSTQQAYPQQGGANAVSINIYNPQAYGATPQANPQQAPYNYTNSLYQMPQTNAYQQPQQLPDAYQQYIPMQTPIAPAPQIMPDSVMTQPEQQVQPQAVPEAQAVPQAPVAPEAQATPEAQQVQTPVAPQQAPETQQAAAPAPEVVQEAAPQAATVNIDELTQGLADTDVDKKAQTINKIAEYAQSEPSTALQVVSEPVMNGLINVINEDTTGLEGPSEKQIAVAEKIAKGEQLTPEEDALSEQLSPRDKANKNRIFALYTLAMIQKLQREELNQYIETQKANGEQPIQPLKIEELPGYNDVVNVIKNDSRPEVKVAAMQALQYVAEPGDKATVETALADSLNSKDEVVKTAAQELLSRFDAPQAPAQDAQQKA